MMSDTLRKVDYFHTMVANTPGQGAKVMAGLAAEGVDLLAFSGFPSAKRAQLDLIPVDPARLKRAAKKLGVKLSLKKTGFLVQGEDRVGAMVDILDKLASAKINVTAVDAISSGDGRFGAIFWVKPPAVAKAARLLGAR
jgi:prephenate dehydratase